MKKIVTDEMIAMWNQSPLTVLEDLAQRVKQEAVQEALRMLPIVNENIVKQAAVLHKLSKEFYEKNQDLTGNKEQVAQQIHLIESRNPGMPYEEILAQAATEIRSINSIKPVPGRKRLSELDDIVGAL